MLKKFGVPPRARFLRLAAGLTDVSIFLNLPKDPNTIIVGT